MDAYLLIRNSDVAALLFVSCLIAYIGRAAVLRHERTFQIGSWIAGVTFLAYCGTAVSQEGYNPIENFAGYMLRGGLAAGISAGAFWIVAAVLLSTLNVVAPIPRYIERKRAAARDRREAKKQQRRELAERQRREEYERPQREAARLRALEQEKARAEIARLEAIDLSRRTESRAQCDLLYSLYAKDIADRFPKPSLTSFMHTYMNDSQSAEVVEQRGRELRGIIEQHRVAARPPKKCHTIQELADWYVKEKQRIDSLPLNEELREEHSVQLSIRYAELTQDMLQKMEP